MHGPIKKPPPPPPPAFEAECRSCGDWVMVPGDEDPEDTLCAPCADDRDSGDEGEDD